MYSHILGALIFDEKLTASTIAGGMLIFVGVLMVTVRSSSSSSSATRGKADHDTLAVDDSNDSNRSQAAELGGAESQALLAGDGRKQEMPSECTVQLGGISIDVTSRATEGSRAIAYVQQQEQQQQQQHNIGGGLRRPPWLQQLLGSDTSGGGGVAVGGSSSSNSSSTDQRQDSSWPSRYTAVLQQPGSRGSYTAVVTTATPAAAAAAVQDDFGPFAAQHTASSQDPGRLDRAAGAAAQQQDAHIEAQHAQQQAALGTANGVASAIGVGDAGVDLNAEQPVLLRASLASWASWPSFGSAAGGSVELLATAQQQHEQQMQCPQQQGQHSCRQ
jgi:hypothetical protein